MAKKAAGADPADGKPAKGKKAKPVKPVKAGAPAAKVVKGAKTVAPKPNAKGRKRGGEAGPPIASAAALDGPQGCCKDELYVDAAGVLRVKSAGAGSAILQSWRALAEPASDPTIEEYLDRATRMGDANAQSAGIAPDPLSLTICIPIVGTAAPIAAAARQQTIQTLLLLFSYLVGNAGEYVGFVSNCCKPDPC